jgi:hypothetical protein
MARKAAAKSSAAAPAPEPRGRGRPKRDAAPAPAPPIAEVSQTTSKKRGRPAKGETDVEEPPKKRGRPPKPVDEAKSALPQTRRVGRPRKKNNAKVAASTVAVAAADPRRSPRAKRVAPPLAAPVESLARRGRKPGRPAKAATLANARVRSNTHGRAAITPPKDAIVKQVPAKRGRKPKAAIRPEKQAGRPPKNAAVAPVAEHQTARGAVAKRHRSRKGYTTMEVPKKMVSVIQQFILDKQAGEDEAETQRALAVQVDGATEEQHAEVDVEAGAEEGSDKPIDGDYDTEIASIEAEDAIAEELATAELLPEAEVASMTPEGSPEPEYESHLEAEMEVQADIESSRHDDTALTFPYSEPPEIDTDLPVATAHMF